MAKVSLTIKKEIKDEVIERFLNEYGFKKTEDNIAQAAKTISSLILENSLDQGDLKIKDFEITVDGK